MDMGFEQKIRERAYEIWMANGMSDGMALAHWCAAEQDLTADAVEPMYAKAPARTMLKAKTAKATTAKAAAPKKAVAKPAKAKIAAAKPAPKRMGRATKPTTSGMAASALN